MELKDIRDKAQFKKIYERMDSYSRKDCLDIEFTSNEYARLARTMLLASGKALESEVITHGNLRWGHAVSAERGLAAEEQEYGGKFLTIKNMNEEEFYAAMEDTLTVSAALRQLAKEHGIMVGDLSLRFSESGDTTRVIVPVVGRPINKDVEALEELGEEMKEAGIRVRLGARGEKENKRVFLDMPLPGKGESLIDKLRTFTNTQKPVMAELAETAADTKKVFVAEAAKPVMLGTLSRSDIRDRFKLNHRMNGNDLVVDFQDQQNRDHPSELAKLARAAMLASGVAPEKIGVDIAKIKIMQDANRSLGNNTAQSQFGAHRMVISNMDAEQFLSTVERMFDVSLDMQKLGETHRIKLSGLDLRFSEGDPETNTDDKIKLVFPAPEVKADKLPSKTMIENLKQAGLTANLVSNKINERKTYGIEMDINAHGSTLLDRLERHLKPLQHVKKFRDEPHPG